MRLRILRRRPSPALIISCVALFLSLGGVSYGLATGSIDTREIADSTIRSADVRNDELRGRDIHDGAVGWRDVAPDGLGGGRINEARLGPVPSAVAAEGAARFAVVTGAGVLARGRGVSSAARTSAGRYQVIFGRDVRSCAYFATVADQGAAAPPAGEISASALASNVNGVSVRTEASNGAAADKPFHLIALC